MKNTTKLILTAGSTLVLALAVAHAAVDPAKLPPASKKTGVTFEKDIKPLFEASCTKCHGAEKQKGKLRVDTVAAIMRGGESGKIVEAGNSAKSLIVHVISGLDPDTAMPPEGKAKPLTPEQVGLVRAWIDQGAK